jgi:hypothetical protein
MAKKFTRDEAEKLIPEVERLIREAVDLKSALVDAQNVLQQFAQRVMMSGGMVVDRAEVMGQRSTRDRASDDLKQAIERIHEQGCIVKDLDIGLVDFPTLFRGKEVYLCWKMGERGIDFWHGVDEGFAGRKPIDEEFLRDHRGDLAH